MASLHSQEGYGVVSVRRQHRVIKPRRDNHWAHSSASPDWLCTLGLLNGYLRYFMARNPRRAMRRPAPNLERIPDGRAKPARRRLLDGPRTPGGPQEAILKAVDKHQVRNQTG